MTTYIHTIGVMNLRHATTSTTIIITWDPAVTPSDCGPVFYYTVTATSLADGSVKSFQRPSQTSAKFSNLINGTSYTISVAAVNRVGSGPSSTIIFTGNIGMYCK